MGTVRASPEAIEALRSRIVRTAQDLVARHGVICRKLVFLASEGNWKDPSYDAFTASMRLPLDRYRDAAQGLESSSAGLGRLVQQLNDYLGSSTVQHLGSYAQAAEAAQARPPSGGSWMTAHRNGTAVPLRSMSASQLRSQTIDWNGMQFATDTHHGYTADDYRSLVRSLPRVTAALEAGRSQDDFAHGSAERACFDAFYGGNPVRIVKRRSGVLAVEEGRHRLAACMEAGIDAPVEWIESDL